MPYRVITDHTEAPASSGAFVYEIHLWPHQSLTGTGFVWVIGISFGMVCMPLVALVGSVVLWGILPFAMAAIAILWFGLQRNWRDRDILETFRLTPETATLERREPNGTKKDWQANPYWVRVKRHEKVGRVEDYLTLEGGSRIVEIGAFLTPGERRSLENDLVRALHRAA